MELNRTEASLDNAAEISREEANFCDALAGFASEYWSTGLQEALQNRDARKQSKSAVAQDADATSALVILSAVVPVTQVVMLGQSSDSYNARRQP